MAAPGRKNITKAKFGCMLLFVADAAAARYTADATIATAAATNKQKKKVCAHVRAQEATIFFRISEHLSRRKKLAPHHTIVTTVPPPQPLPPSPPPTWSALTLPTTSKSLRIRFRRGSKQR